MNRYYNIANKSERVSLKQAVLQGMGSHNGLFMPLNITPMERSFFERIGSLTLPEIAFEVAKHLLGSDISDRDLKEIIDRSITFEAPLVKLENHLYTLELFHGPTLSFKDFGARFMASLVSYFLQNSNQRLSILAATSGDTGSAVAQGFYKAPGIHVWVLYPKGQISKIQEKQITTLGKNVTAVEVSGTFDDCQRLVKQAFADADLASRIGLTSANSINIARLIPQTFYYFNAYAQLPDKTMPVVISVPSGNFGNLTAGLFAKKMGLPIDRFIAATNINDVVPEYLQTGVFKPRPSIPTISNAMDVGNPSNYTRILELYGNDIDKIREDIVGYSFTDDETRQAIVKIFQDSGYIADPHGAVAYLGFKSYQKENPSIQGIFLETAHPAKFFDVVQPLVHAVDIPNTLQNCLNKETQHLQLSNSYMDLKQLLTK